MKKWVRVKGKLMSLVMDDRDECVFDSIERQDGLIAAFTWWRRKYKPARGRRCAGVPPARS